jgi:hypothetical protein
MRRLLRPIKRGLSRALPGSGRLGRARPAIQERLGRVMLRLASPFARALSRLVPGNAAYEAFARQGYHLLRKHYYLPIPDEQDLQDPLVNEASDLVGVDLNEAAALDFTRSVCVKYREEFRRSFPVHGPAAGGGFHLVNGAFMAGDAHVYYAMIRHHRPKRIVEIGGGSSSLLAAAACLRNQEEYGRKPHLTVVEPYPGEALRAGFPGLDRVLVERVQSVDMGLFTSLEAGDICFIDSTHVLKPGGDVQREYCEILPRLAPGVLVHIHDISLPKPYFQFYFQNHLYWNEQYLLQAFLAYNARFEVLWPGTYLFMRHPEEMLRVFPEIRDMREKFPLAEPSSFWIRSRAA